MLRTGIIIRSTARGLATQSQEAWRGFPFDAALHVIDNDPVWPENLWEPHRPEDTYEATLKNGEFLRHEVEPFLAAVDVVFSIETLYSHDFAKMLMHRSMRAIVQGNCELWYPSQPQNLATKWVWPTPWRLEGVPEGPTIPVPVAATAHATAGDPSSPLVVLHPAGHRAVGDRNGTDLFVMALQHIKTPITVRLIGQDGEGSLMKAALRRLPDHINLEIVETGVNNRWQMYDGAHLVVLPRRYGGLCLPVQEALQCGVVPLMTNCEPNTFWPIVPIPATKGRSQLTKYGRIETWIASARHIARRIDEMNQDRGKLAEMSGKALLWAEAHSWDHLAPWYHQLFQSRL